MKAPLYIVTPRLAFLLLLPSSNSKTVLPRVRVLIAFQREPLTLPHNYDAMEHRIRCLGHILNLTVQAFLCVQDIKQVEGASIEDINANQRFGALGKLHNLAVTLSRDPQKLQRFQTISEVHGSELSSRTSTEYVDVGASLIRLSDPAEIARDHTKKPISNTHT
jgi:hypothetical protein